MQPTVFSEVTNDMTIAQEEIFGPVLSIMPYDSEDDAVAIANDSPYGLSGGVWSADQERAKGVAKRIRTGQIEVNGGAFNPNAPFGGYKQSGYGREYGDARLRGVPRDQEHAAVGHTTGSVATPYRSWYGVARVRSSSASRPVSAQR